MTRNIFHLSFISTVVQILIKFTIVRCDIISIIEEPIFPTKPFIIPLAKFFKDEVPSWSPGKGRSYIDLTQLKLLSVCDASLSKSASYISGGACSKVNVDVIMFEAPTDKPWKSFWEDEQYCCLEGMDCPSKNSVIIPSALPGVFKRRVEVGPGIPSVLFSGEDEISHHDIKVSGLFIVIIALCDTTDTKPVILNGQIDSIDPYGYLPAEQFGNLPFYFALSCMYAIVGVTWLILCLWYSTELMPLQIWISAVLMIGALETSLLFLRYINWNDMGYPATALTFLGGFFGVAKRALSRILVQLVCLGYGVVRPSLGEEMGRVLYLGFAYFVLSSLYTIMSSATSATNTGQVDPAHDFVALVSFFLAVVDTTFYIWIFTSINNLIVSLASRQQGVKYLLYKNFRAVLFSLLFFTCLWALYSSVVFLKDTSGSNFNWRERWTVDALWELIYFCIFVAIAILWAPSKNAQRYAHSMELAQLDDDSEWQSVQSAIELTNNQSNGSHGDGVTSHVVGGPTLASGGEDDRELDSEYGGRLHDEKDPFQGTGALDPLMAISKKA